MTSRLSLALLALVGLAFAACGNRSSEYSSDPAVGAYVLERLRELETLHAGIMSNSRGQGLMCAFDLPDTKHRDRFRKHLLEQEKVVILASGPRSVRFRPVLDFTRDHADDAIARIGRALRANP